MEIRKRFQIARENNKNGNSKQIGLFASAGVKINSDIESVYVTSDGQENIKISGNDTISIGKYENKAFLIHIEDEEESGFYSILRKKLHWGVSPSS